MSDLEFVNSVKIRGIVHDFKCTWSGETNSIHEVTIECGKVKDRTQVAVVKLFKEQVETPGFGVGAIVEFVGECDGRLSKDGKKFYGEIVCRKLNVKLPAREPKKPEQPELPLDDIDIPF